MIGCNKKTINIVRGVVLSIISVVLSLFLIELLMGVIGYKNKEHNWQWEVSPKFTGYFFDKERIYSIDKNLYNDGGFRYSPDHKQFDLFDDKFHKIVVLGDSVTFGVGVSENETYPYFLERQLKKNGIKDILVHNAGVSGYGVDQEFLYLRDDILPRIKPDLVVWSINVNDVYDSNSACLFTKKRDIFLQVPASYNFLYLQGLANRVLPTFVLESRIYNLFISVMSKFFTGTTGENRFTFGCTIKDIKDNEEIDGVVYSKIEYLLSKAKQLSADNGTDIILVLVPLQQYFNKRVSNGNLTSHYSKMVQILSSSGIDFVDINVEILKEKDIDFLKYRLEKTVFEDNGEEWNKRLFMGDDDLSGEGWRHPNSAGYELMAKILAKKIDEIK